MELLPLVCFCLLTCSGTTFGDEVTKIIVIEDEDVILPCSLDSTNIRSDTFDWKKDDQKEVFLYAQGSHYNNGRSGQDPQFKDRVFHFEDQLQSGNASIVIRKTTGTDDGRYSCIFPFHQPTTRSMIELIVGAAPKPHVIIINQANGGVLLQCEVRGAFPKPKVVWKDRAGNILPAEEPEVKKYKGIYNIVLKTNVTKTDHYRCVSTQEEINHEVYTETYVSVPGGSFPGAALKPHVKIVKETNGGVLLQCEVQDASPKPKVVWKDRAGNILRAEEPEVKKYEGIYNIVLKTTVTKTGYYHCVSTQEEIYHEVHYETYVSVPGAAPKPVITLHPANEAVLLQCVVAGASPKPKVVWKDRAGNVLPAKEPEVTEYKGRYNIILKTTVTKTDNYSCVSTQEEISHEVHTETHVIVPEPPGPNTGPIIGGVVCVLIFVVVAVVAVLCTKRKYHDKPEEKNPDEKKPEDNKPEEVELLSTGSDPVQQPPNGNNMSV